MTTLTLAITSAALATSFVCGMMVEAARSAAKVVSETRVTGIGGVFFKAHDAPKLAAWYREHLGITFEGDDSGAFHPFEWLEKDNPSKTESPCWRFSQRRRNTLAQEIVADD